MSYVTSFIPVPLLLLILRSEIIDADSFMQTANFASLKSIDGDDVCAVDIAPLTSFVAASKIKCASECTKRQSPTKCVGVNYWKENMTCDLFDNDQTPFVVQSGCEYYTVSRNGTPGDRNMCGILKL